MFRSNLYIYVYLGFALITNIWTQELNKVTEDPITSCDCYMLGTIETKHGLSQCNEKGSCKCLPNVVGTKCSKCKEGFYGILEGKGCNSCGCNEEGSQSKNCHQATGQCLCNDGYTGLLCDMCDTFEASPMATCTTPCDMYRSIDAFALYENGTCKCKPRAIGPKCERCEANFYFNQTTFECTTCPTCYTVVAAKTNEAMENLQKISEITNSLQSSEKPEYEFLVKLKTMQNNICSLLNTLLSKPHFQQIVKLKHLEGIVDLTEKGIEDIMFYLNGHINYHHIKKKLHKLEEMFSKLEQQVKNSPVENDAEIKKIAEQAHDEAEELTEVVDVLDSKTRILADDANQNLTIATEIVLELKEEQNSDFKQFFKELNGNLEDSTKLLEQAKQQWNDAKLNKQNSNNNYDEAKKLKLPETIKHELKPIINGTFADLSERIQDAKRKYDAINDILNVLNDTESKSEINGDVDNTLTNRMKHLSTSVDEEQIKLSDKLEECLQTGEELNDLRISLDKDITKLNSDIDKKQQELKDIFSNVEKAKEQVNKHNKNKQELQEQETYLTDLLDIWTKYKGVRKELKELINITKELLHRRKQVQALLDETQEAIREFKTYIEKYTNQIGLMKELTAYLKLIPIDEFDEIEELLKEYAEYFKFIRISRKEKKMLEEEVQKLAIILNSLPDENPYNCRSVIT